MLGNIVDMRTDGFYPRVDAVFQPSFYSYHQGPDGSFTFSAEGVEHSTVFFDYLLQRNTDVRSAVIRAEKDWDFLVTIFLYDAGSRPAD